METSLLIFFAKQWTNFYIIRTSTMEELKQLINTQVFTLIIVRQELAVLK